MRTADELREAIFDGNIWKQPFTGESYSSIDYWPPLFPIFSACVGGAYAVSALSGVLAIIPMFFLARDFFGSGVWNIWPKSVRKFVCVAGKNSNEELDWADRSALVVAGIMALHPYLAWLARTPRSETLYILFFVCSIWCLWTKNSSGNSAYWRWFMGGLSLAFAYETRFDGLFLWIPVVLSAYLLQGKRILAWVLAGFIVGALPYWIYLSWLNGGFPTMLPPHKLLYDALEGAWTRVYHKPLFDFVTQFGPPGIFSLRGQDAEIKQLLDSKVPMLIGEGILNIPQNLWSVSINWSWLFLPLSLSSIYWKDRRSQALCISCLPILAMAIFMSWDIAPRYFAFSIAPLSILAGKGLELIARCPVPNKRWHWMIASVGIPLWLGTIWVVPLPAHFDQHGPVDMSFLSLVPNISQTKFLLLASGISLASLLCLYFSAWKSGIIASLMAIFIGGGSIISVLGISDNWNVVPLITLIALMIAPGILFTTMPKSRWGYGLWGWTLIVWSIVASGSLITLEFWSVAHGKVLYDVGIGEFLSLHKGEVLQANLPRGSHTGFGNSGPRVLSLQQIDAIRSGARWLPWPSREKVSVILKREKPDYIIVANQDLLRQGESHVLLARDLESTGMVQLVKIFEPSLPGNLKHQWRVYRMIPER